ncbi:DNA-binding MarR family transcriptional regulator [Hoeflea marina]|uniref:DNA-binding MarR family transcriptional regulator n=1 Tax=Hoeflea marina TaxID=274592 RepID=A0A317PMU1_9HYPH|nr:helix-turn-helix domain-containing protein [Hoeflea marina]PWW01843.1 DNA-binding MarR family transcriptional regulator [Hoeflea marina]
MTDSTDSGRALGGLIFETLRLAGRLTLAGDALMAGVGLTAARWQIMGVIAYLPSPRTVSALSRVIGQSRQAVQRIVNDLHTAGLVDLLPNPAHRRAPLVALSDRGQTLYAEAEARRVPWTEALAADIGDHDLKAAQTALSALRRALERREG